MSNLDLLLKGLAIGLAIAAPVGPIGLLCIRRSLAQGRLAGFVTGLGAATADGVYGAIGAFGITAISALLIDQQRWLALAGGLFLIWLGIAGLRRAPAVEAAAPPRQARDLAGYFLSTFALTLTNPATILSFAAVFAGLGLGGAGSVDAALVTIAGVFAGSALWWLCLSAAVGWLRERLGPGLLVWINRLSGLVLIGFGLVAVWTALR
ncbi:lysine transporter LysE [Hypericibacter adhaerens]|uniref:Lysine transporter LysE n=1 Tax=Hypericibacter adhaerens TaxID=2602016 RepID=A0A5J6N7L0_9PROT|nr:LysE family transporter [Hypericibacter adhaerens]QEX23096.1 lysine transporter LysE [Hypericibacter adhaerens]